MALVDCEEEIEAEGDFQESSFEAALDVLVRAYAERQAKNNLELEAFQKLSDGCVTRLPTHEHDNALNEYRAIVEGRERQHAHWKNKWEATIDFMSKLLGDRMKSTSDRICELR